jgi:hypothetical protein
MLNANRFLICIVFTIVALGLSYIITGRTLAADEPRSLKVKVEVYNAGSGADIMLPYQSHAHNGQVDMATAGKVLKQVGIYNCVIDGKRKTVQLTFTLCTGSHPGPLNWIGSLPIQPAGIDPKSTPLVGNFSAFAQLVEDGG